MGRAGAGLVPDRLPPVLLLPAAALLDRGSREAGALRERVRDRRRRVRADQLHGGAAGDGARPPARAIEDHRRLAADRDADHVPRVAARGGAPIRDALEGRADREEREHEAEEAAPPPRQGRARGPGGPRRARARGCALMLVLAASGGKYVAA